MNFIDISFCLGIEKILMMFDKLLGGGCKWK